ncbi:cytochrome P450 [Xylariomycetidae sp. FL2044]|nr:cytochrome P450 [Xylariomycetidae sp. FL2044]
MTSTIPGPWPLPFLGNLRDIDPANSIRDMANLADTHGPIYKLRIGGEDRIIVTSHELVNEVSSRKEFAKYPLGFLRQLRDIVGEGLFTAYPNQESWGVAHRTLIPAFGSVPIKDSFPEMMDIASQLLLKWARFGADHAINPVQDFTRLTIDTLALCTMDTRFNSFYMESVPPYVKSMMGLLGESQLRTYRPWWYTALMRESNRRFDENNELVHQLAQTVIERRRANPSKKKDLVDAMLNGRDPKTGKKLTDDLIVDNMITFFIAGHETTSGLLSFLLAFLLTHPEAYSKVQDEVDRVVGSSPITPEHLKDLSYTKACIWETLRLEPPSGLWTVTCIESEAPVLLANQWEIKPGQTMVVVNRKLHRDPKVWGEDAEEFKPERMLGENFTNLPKNSLKAFGNGQRACIGRAFALQEAMLAITLLFQKFDFTLADPNYKISVKQTLSLKPHDYFVHAKLRPHVDIMSLQRDLFVPSTAETGSKKET